ncbi:hypothetical protein, partial [Nitrobacter sp.]|uniref:hypothetical protein n=1 Tax=Nitrobacter sp. TaxID=29420 RepID=UPI0025E1EDE3
MRRHWNRDEIGPAKAGLLFCVFLRQRSVLQKSSLTPTPDHAESEAGLYDFNLTRFLDANRYPLRSKALSGRLELGSVLNKDSHERGYVIQAFHDLGAWMAKQVYWLSDVEWRRIEPLLPRGRR